MKSVKASAQRALIYWALIHTVKLETDELPHFGSDSQIPLDTGDEGDVNRQASVESTEEVVALYR